jgi:hypothetical protein
MKNDDRESIFLLPTCIDPPQNYRSGKPIITTFHINAIHSPGVARGLQSAPISAKVAP